jgi:hypothetical protein
MGVTWSVNGFSGGNSSVGTIAVNGPDAATYTAPDAPPSPVNVTVAATSMADPSKSGSVIITFACSASNSISPFTASVSLGQTQTFTTSFCLPSGTTVAWDVNWIAGGNSNRWRDQRQRHGSLYCARRSSRFERGHDSRHSGHNNGVSFGHCHKQREREHLAALGGS